MFNVLYFKYWYAFYIGQCNPKLVADIKFSISSAGGTFCLRLIVRVHLCVS
jgi:hypothetical protein